MQLGALETVTYFITNAFRIYTICLFYVSFLEPKVSPMRRAARYCCCVLYFSINSMGFLYFQWGHHLVMVSNLVGMFVLSFTYLGKWSYRVCATILILAIQIICEASAYRMLLYWQAKHLFFIGTIVSGLLSFMVILFIQRIIDFKRGENFSWQEWIITFFVPASSIFLSIFIFDDCKNEIEIVASGICMLLLNILLFFLLGQIVAAYKDQLMLFSLTEQNQAYENQIQIMEDSKEKIMSLRYDMKNHLLVMDQIAQNEKYKKIQDYLESLTPHLGQSEELVSTGNLIVDSIVNLKVSQAASLEVAIHLNIVISNDIGIDQNDICIILGNLLDNALLALEKCDSASKKLDIMMRENQGIVRIQVGNSYSGEVKKNGVHFKTTKLEKEGEVHGLGLKIVERVVHNYQGKIEVDAGAEYFKVNIWMYIGKKDK